MGEENQVQEVKEEKKEESKEEKKEEEKKEDEPPEIVLKVDMHCEACARKVARSLKGFEGVEVVTTDIKASKVVVKGKAANPIKVCERLQKKSGKKVEIISPLPKPTEENKEEKKEDSNEEQKQEPHTVVTVVLKVRMHCDACAQLLQKRIRKIQGVESVETDLAKDQVIVKGVVDPAKLVGDVYKKTKKQASIVQDEGKKKEEEKKEEQVKKEEENEGNKGDEEKKMSDIKRSEYWPSKYFSDYAYAYPQIFSDENPNACIVM
ncbi:HMA domain-containing protein [Cephalotus follicularis]|uniref:HMA domain-containing protein n=1 Tax=Cephalotus follicularis TaxID=3775 RepID=A0A1Q3AVU1_CEPFO|nr:HMA domain-containing protein [Cephalotus follicularis]